MRWRNRPIPKLSTSAPPEWDKGGASSSARLHRRLLAALENAETAIARCRAEATEADRLSELCQDLGMQAIAIDERVVVASKLPLPKRQRALLPLRNEVDQVETLAHRIATSAVEARGHGPGGQGLQDIEAGLGSLDAARRELSDPLPALPKQRRFWRRNP